MRIRSLHPSYLDSKGLIALWRETLLAQHVLAGKTKGYTNHPQLNRFKAQSNPLGIINSYLTIVHQEATRRGYNFDKTKIGPLHDGTTIPVTSGQIQYEYDRLCSKLMSRSPADYTRITQDIPLVAHPLFTIIQGDIEAREKL